MASIQWTPPTGWVEETGAHVLMLTPCDGTATSTLTIGANAYTIVDGMGASFSMRAGVFAAGALLEFVLDVNAKKAYLLSQAGLSAAPQKPKLLWSGSWSSGSITVYGFSAYKLFFVQTTDGDAALCWVDFSLLLGGGFYPLAGDGGQMLYNIRAHVDGDTLTMENSYAILRPQNSVSAGKYGRTVKAIYGLLLTEDVLVEGT